MYQGKNIRHEQSFYTILYTSFELTKLIQYFRRYLNSFIGKSVEIFQDKSAELYRNRSADLFHDSNVAMFHLSNAGTFLANNVTNSAETSFGVKFAQNKTMMIVNFS